MFSSGSLIFSDFNSSCVPCPHSCVGHIVFAVMFVFVILPNIMVCFSNYGHFWDFVDLEKKRIVHQKMKLVTLMLF